MSQTKETEYQQLVDNFVEQFKGDYKDVIDDMTVEVFKDRLLDIAQNTMPQKERAILLAQEPALKIITSRTTTDNNRQKAISDYQQQLNSTKDEVDKALEALEEKQNPSEMERREHADAMFEMHMLMVLQEKVDSIAKNMSDPDTARVMANTQHDTRKFVRDIRRDSMNLAKEAAEAKDPEAIGRISDRLSMLERKVNGTAVRKDQNINLHVAESDEKMKNDPSDETKIDNAFYHNNQDYFRFSMEGIRESLSTARNMIMEALQKVTQTPVTPPETSSAKGSPKVERRRSSIGNVFKRIRESREKRASERQSKRNSQRDSTASTTPPAAETAPIADNNNNPPAREPSSVAADKKSSINLAEFETLLNEVDEKEVDEKESSHSYEFLEENEQSEELIDSEDQKNPEIAKKLSEIPEAPPANNNKTKSFNIQRPKSRPASTHADTNNSASVSNRNSAAEKPKEDAKSVSSTQKTTSFPTGRSPKPSTGLMQTLARVKAEAQAKKQHQNNSEVTPLTK